MTEKLKTVLEFDQLKMGDNQSKMNETYAAGGANRANSKGTGLRATDGRVA